MEPVRGVEPLTCGLRNRCSATELHRLGVYSRYGFGCSYSPPCTSSCMHTKYAHQGSDGSIPIISLRSATLGPKQSLLTNDIWFDARIRLTCNSQNRGLISACQNGLQGCSRKLSIVGAGALPACKAFRDRYVHSANGRVVRGTWLGCKIENAHGICSRTFGYG